jgi:hypothetical protein
MTKLPKNPQEKKHLSLERDTRNSYGENAKASRKNIPLRKQESRQVARRAGKAPLHAVTNASDIDQQDQQELAVLAAEKKYKLDAFKKQSDISLGTALERRRASPDETSRKNYGRRPV